MTAAPTTVLSPMQRTQTGHAPGTSVELIVALDVGDLDAAKRVVLGLGDACDFYKVGLELFTAEGPPVVSWLRECGKQVFVDLKLHDIPNTVRGAARSVARMGASLLTVHASGGTDMIRAAVEGAAEGDAQFSATSGNDGRCGILAVTVLTSLSEGALASIWGRPMLATTDEVKRLASSAQAAGARGVVCSGFEVAAVRAAFGSGLGVLVPGIRMAGSPVHDQARVATPGGAAANGARWLVIGRAVTKAADPVLALRTIRTEVDTALGAASTDRSPPGSTGA